MKLQIDPTVIFELPNDRVAIMDAYELAEFKRALYETQGKQNEATGERELEWAIIVKETAAFVKLASGIDLKPSEAIAVFQSADSAWQAKKKSWEQPTEALPICADSTDPRYAA